MFDFYEEMSVKIKYNGRIVRRVYLTVIDYKHIIMYEYNIIVRGEH